MEEATCLWHQRAFGPPGFRARPEAKPQSATATAVQDSSVFSKVMYVESGRERVAERESGRERQQAAESGRERQSYVDDSRAVAGLRPSAEGPLWGLASGRD